MAKLKIGFVLDDTLDSSDGVQQYILALGDWLKKQGNDVHYIVGSTKRTDVKNTHSFSKNVRVRFNRNRLSIPLPASPRKIYNFLVEQQFDVLHVQMPFSPMLSARVISLAPVTTAIVGTFHIAPFSKFESAASRLLGFWLKPDTLKFDKVISVSSTAADFALRSFKVKSTIIPNPVDINAFKAKPHKKTKPIITFVGRLVPRKGAMHLAKTIRYMHKAYPDLDFAARICGEGKDARKLKRYIKRHKLSDYIWLEGFISEQKKKEYLASSDVAVFPATGGESFGIVLIEAMAAGSGVVLAGNNDGYKSVMDGVKESIIDPKDHQKFADKIASMITQPEVAEEIHQKQQELVKKFDINVVGTQVQEVYERAVANRAHEYHN